MLFYGKKKLFCKVVFIHVELRYLTATRRLARRTEGLLDALRGGAPKTVGSLLRKATPLATAVCAAALAALLLGRGMRIVSNCRSATALGIT
ncbi:MAG: hypothetical protein CBC12_05135 [Candidatus Puniceispirillum sp. TMED52]|nr:MAG: hypothetical protein CBC12_05135 [Candidatus Puniceispirillum sp. TMED52]